MDRDGTKKGFDLELLIEANKILDIPLIASGGVGTKEHFYEGANHGFHNNTTPRYDEKAATLAWDRTIAFFNKYLTA